MSRIVDSTIQNAPTLRRRAHIRRNLLRWYDANQRELPWRTNPSPYRTWISEIMLQQTQVATVLPFFERFIARFPTVRALAAAPIDAVLEHWSGLGYYSRARNLHAAAQVICEQYQGRFPETYQGLRALPGVGAYTAGAIASICFGERVPAVDGNVLRVVARLTSCDLPINSTAGKAAIDASTHELLPRKRVGDFNQALMELGARICRPGPQADCPACPLRNQCEARAHGRVADLPVKQKTSRMRQQNWIVFALQDRDQLLLRRRPARGLWGGLWELPSVVIEERDIRSGAHMTLRDLWSSWGLGDDELRIRKIRPFGQISHQLTHIRICFHGFRYPVTEAQRCNIATTKDLRWTHSKRARALAISTAMRKVLNELDASQRGMTGLNEEILLK